MNLTVEPFLSSKFTFRNNCFITEASTLRNQHLQQLYNDAYDVGLAIRSIRTNNVVDYYLDKEIQENGEIVKWFYKPTTESLKQVPECQGTTVIVFND